MPATTAIDALRSAGGRVTAARRGVLEAMAATEDHLSADQLAEVVRRRVPDVHRSTIYRALDDLEAFGVVVHAHLGHGPTTYQLAATSHAHFVCEACGLSFRAPDGLFRTLVARAERDHGFIVDVPHLAVPGRCEACKA